MSLTFLDSQARVLARLEALVRGIMPLRYRELPFLRGEGDDGTETALEEMVTGFRYFQWRYAEFPDRPTDRPSCRVVLPLVLRIRYDWGDLGKTTLERTIAEDLVTIDDALRIPSAWQSSATGLIVIRRSGKAGKTTLPNADSPKFTIVGAPYEATLEACC